jgi:hypothetical protein
MLIRVVCFWKFEGSPANTGDLGGSRAIRKSTWLKNALERSRTPGAKVRFESDCYGALCEM